ncbi:MAG: alpha/beta fold hydrolase [Chitinivibrionales bacterium]
MNSLLFRLYLMVLALGVNFVPQEKYQEKVAQIKTMDDKNIGVDLQGWQYKKLVSESSGIIHRYYEYSSEKPDAPYMIMLHGLSLDGRTFIHYKSLSEQYNLLAYDFPERDDYYRGYEGDFSTMVEDFAVQKGIDTGVVFGVSFGGIVAIRLASTASELHVSHLILASTQVMGVSEEDRRRSSKLSEWIGDKPDYKIYWIVDRMLQYFDASEQVAPLLRIKHPDFYRKVITDAGGYNGAADARRISCPVLVLQGSDDDLFSTEDARNIKDYVPWSDVEIIPNGSHAMIYLHGKEIAWKINRWIESGQLLAGQR